MEINVNVEKRSFTLYLNKNDSIREIKKKIIEKLITESIPHDSHSFFLRINGGEYARDDQNCPILILRKVILSLLIFAMKLMWEAILTI